MKYKTVVRHLKHFLGILVSGFVNAFYKRFTESIIIELTNKLCSMQDTHQYLLLIVVVVIPGFFRISTHFSKTFFLIIPRASSAFLQLNVYFKIKAHDGKEVASSGMHSSMTTGRMCVVFFLCVRV